MMQRRLLRGVDAVTIPVPDLERGLAFYRDALGHRLVWRNDELGQAGLELSEADTELVLTVRHGYEPNWLVDSAEEAAATIVAAGGRLIDGPSAIPVGTVCVVADPFGNPLVLVDLAKGHYTTAADGTVTGISTV